MWTCDSVIEPQPSLQVDESEGGNVMVMVLYLRISNSWRAASWTSSCLMPLTSLMATCVPNQAALNSRPPRRGETAIPIGSIHSKSPQLILYASSGISSSLMLCVCVCDG